MPDLSLYKVDLDTPQPNGRNGESPRAAFTKYNDLVEQLEGGIAGRVVSDDQPTNTFAYMEWIDTSVSPAIIKRRDSNDIKWVEIGTYSQTLGTAAGKEASLTKNPDKVPLANDQGKIDVNWLPALAHARSQADMEAERAANKALYAASGFVHMGKHTTVSTAAPVNEGMFTVVGSGWQNKFGLGRNTDAMGASETNQAVFHAAGITFDLIGVSDIASTPFVVKLPEAPKGTEVYDSATGILTNYETAAEAFDAAANEATKEVVTHPVDLVGFEVFLREINELDPIIYPYGMQQSKLTTVDGIPTVENTFRPITHFEVFKGDETSRGRGWNVLDGSLTDAQLAKVFQNSKHKVVRLSDGRLVQWTLSQRTIRGAGNGDYWYNPATSTTTIPLWFDAAGNRCVSVRGALDSVEPFVASTGNWYQGWNAADSVKGIPELTNLGAFIPRRSATNVAVNGECYFYVIATVPRLNQGAYHPSFNPFGTAKFVGNSRWFSVATQSTKDCFINRFDGYMTSGNSGLPDAKFYDAIYSDGLNGVIDWRTSAHDVGSKEEAAKVTQKVINGTYRGLEKLIWTKLLPSVVTTGWNIANNVIAVPSNTLVDYVGEKVTVYSESGNIKTGVVGNNYIGSLSPKQANDNTGIAAGETIYILVHQDANISVSGNFLQTDLIGSPAEILNVEALKNGWLGSWIPVIPDGTALDYPATRKALNTPAQAYSTDGGALWSYGASLPNGWNSIKNARLGVGYPTNAIAVWHYQAFAKQTKSSASASVLNGSEGLGDVWAGDCFHAPTYGVLLGESLLGKIFKNDTHRWLTTARLTHSYLAGSNSLNWSTGSSIHPKHEPIDLAAPNNNSPAVKALWYQISNNQQCSLAFAFNELSHNGTDWGDDSAIKLVNNTTTYTNLNGDVLLCGTAELAIPYGYTKNKARVGEQTAGVDL